jgi:hypothetical protein
LKRSILRQYGEPVMRWCSQHKDHALTAGGQYLIENEGRTRRWICAQCLANAERRRLKA